MTLRINLLNAASLGKVSMYIVTIFHILLGPSDLSCNFGPFVERVMMDDPIVIHAGVREKVSVVPHIDI